MGIRSWIGLVIVVLIVLLCYRFYMFSNMLNGAWIASSDFLSSSQTSEILIVIDGGIFNKNITLTVESGGEVATDVGTLTIYPQLCVNSQESTMKSKIGIETMSGANRIKLTTDGQLMIDGDKTYFEGLRL